MKHNRPLLSKALAVIGAIVILFASLSVGVFAETSVPPIVSFDSSAVVNGKFSVDVYIRGNIEVYSATFTVPFDNNLVTSPTFSVAVNGDNVQLARYSHSTKFIASIYTSGDQSFAQLANTSDSVKLGTISFTSKGLKSDGSNSFTPTASAHIETATGTFDVSSTASVENVVYANATSTRTGKVGSDDWSYDPSTGTLTVSGTAVLADVARGKTPWYPYHKYIKKIVVKNAGDYTNGIGSIGNYVFCDMSALETVVLGNKNCQIKANAFYNCKAFKLETIDATTPQGTVPANATIAKHNCTFSQNVTKVSTCSENGTRVDTCTVCGKINNVTLDLDTNNHKFDKYEVTKAPTKTETGVLTGTCSYNSAHKTTVTMAKLGATYYTVTTVAVGCTNDGTTTYVWNANSKYGVNFSATVVDKKQTGHSWNAYAVTTAPTVSAAGVLTRTCKNNSSHKETASVPKLNTTDYTVTTKAPTCTAQGTKTYVWKNNSKYGVNVSVTVGDAAATGHTWSYNVTKRPTAEKGFLGIVSYKTGTVVYTCSVCGASVTRELPKLNTNSYTISTNDPTCTGKSYKSYSYTDTFTQDGKSYTVTSKFYELLADALGHSWGSWTAVDEKTHARTCTRDSSHKETGDHTFDSGSVTTAATCAAEGVRTYTCTVCGYKKTEKIAVNASNHAGETEVRDAVAATCTKAGYSGDTYCLDCGEMIKSGSEIAAKGHSWDEGVVTTEATCVEEGVKTFTCSVCKATKTEKTAVDASNHVGETEVRNAVAAACTKAGYTGDTYCLSCETVIAEGSEIPAAGHKWNEGEITTPATCAEEGVKTFTCSICKETRTEAVPVDKSNHVGETEVRNAVTATCTDPGYTGDTYCLACGSVLSEGSEIPAAGHKWNEGEITTPATCAEEGVKTFTCSVCKATRTESVPVDAANHTGETEVRNAVAAACTEKGYTGDTYCLACGNIISAGAEIEATGHSFSEWTTVTPASITEDGKEERTCSVCGVVETRDVPFEGEIVTVTDESGDISASYESSAVADGAEVVVEEVADGELAVAVNSQAGSGAVTIVDVKAIEGEETSEINGSVSVSIKIPDGFHSDSLKLYSVKPNGEMTEIGFTETDGAAVTIIDNGGVIALVDTTPAFDQPFILGDIDLDGEVTAADARLALRNAVNLEEVDSRQTLAGNVDFDDSISPADARAILRAVVSLEELAYPEGYAFPA